jgi:general L-amino acid transport system permease protein
MTSSSTSPSHRNATSRLVSSILNVLLNANVLQAITQIIVAALVVIAVSQLWSAILFNLEANNLTPNLNFLNDRAGFDIAERPDWYSSNSNYGAAFLVGVINSLRVILVGLVLTTIVGVLAGIALLSTNFLVRNVTRFIVEILRNTPLLVQLIFWYSVVIFSLPDFRTPLAILSEGVYLLLVRHLLLGLAALVLIPFIFIRLPYGKRSTPIMILLGILIVLELLGSAFGIFNQSLGRLEIYPTLFVSRRGVAFPEFRAMPGLDLWLLILGIGIAAAIAQWIILGRETERTGKPYPRMLYALGAIILAAVIGWLIVRASGTAPLIYVPPVQRVNASGIVSGYESGTSISPEYLALLLGLVVYTAAFIAEIVRAGILAVPRGQVEAARALGLRSSQMFSMIILPQAMRVILPPLGSQYLNLAKNSTLAIAIAYADTVAVTTTIMNQSGQSVTGIAMIMVTYLAISLVLSLLTNIANYQFRIITR